MMYISLLEAAAWNALVDENQRILETDNGT